MRVPNLEELNLSIFYWFFLSVENASKKNVECTLWLLAYVYEGIKDIYN